MIPTLWSKAFRSMMKLLNDWIDPDWDEALSKCFKPSARPLRQKEQNDAILFVANGHSHLHTILSIPKRHE